MKRPVLAAAKILGATLLFIIFIGFAADTGSVIPPKNALVYLSADGSTIYAPHHAPEGASPVSYAKAKKLGARLSEGLAIDGPSMTVWAFEAIGIIPEVPRYWARTDNVVERVTSTN